MTDTPPGWYTDPSGLPGAFRWWDGRQWTQDLTSDPATTPPPGGAAPAPPAAGPPAGPTAGFPPGPGAGGPPGGGGPQGGGPQGGGPVPPPSGAPGPGYVPPPFAPQYGPSEVLGSDPSLYDEPSEKRSKVLVAGGIGLAVLLILGVIGGVWWFNRDDGTPTASDPPATSSAPDNDQENDRQNDPGRGETDAPEPTTPETEDVQPSEPETDPSEDPQTPPRLTFAPMGEGWTDSPTLGRLLLEGGLAQSQVTEKNWDGQQHNWVAVAAAGYARDGWGAKDLRSVADNALTWFAGSNFGDSKVNREPLGTSDLKVDGHQGILVKERFSYTIEGLQAKGETVYVAVVDLGGRLPPGIFLGSVPDTHEQLVADIDQAVASLSVE